MLGRMRVPGVPYLEVPREERRDEAARGLLERYGGRLDTWREEGALAVSSGTARVLLLKKGPEWALCFDDLSQEDETRLLRGFYPSLKTAVLAIAGWPDEARSLMGGPAGRRGSSRDRQALANWGTESEKRASLDVLQRMLLKWLHDSRPGLKTAAD